MVRAECWNARKRRHGELLADEANAAERHEEVNKQEEANKQECEKEECAYERIVLVEAIHIFLNISFNIGFY